MKDDDNHRLRSFAVINLDFAILQSLKWARLFPKLVHRLTRSAVMSPESTLMVFIGIPRAWQCNVTRMSRDGRSLKTLDAEQEFIGSQVLLPDHLTANPRYSKSLIILDMRRKNSQVHKFCCYEPWVHPTHGRSSRSSGSLEPHNNPLLPVKTWSNYWLKLF